MTNTKRWSKEPDRSPLQTRASTLLAIVFLPSRSSRGSKRSSAAKPRPDQVAVEAKSGAERLQQAGGRQSAPEAVRCSSPTLEGNTTKDNALGQQVLSGSLLQLDSLNEADFDLRDLMLDEDDDGLIGVHTDGAVSAAAPASAGAAGCISAADAVPAGALLCQQLAQQLSEQHSSILAQQQQQARDEELGLQQQQQQQQQCVSDTLVVAAAAAGNGPTSSPAFDGTAFILESTATVPSQPEPAPVAVSAATCVAAASDHDGHGDSFIAVDKMLEQLTVDAMLNQQYIMERQQQQHLLTAAGVEPVHAGPLPAAPDPKSLHGEHVAAAAAAQHLSLLRQQQHPQQQFSQCEQQCIPAMRTSTPMHTAASSVFQLTVPEVWQQQQQVLPPGAAASLPLALDGSNSSNIDTVMAPQQQLQVSTASQPHQHYLDPSADQTQPFSFRALLMDESMTPSATTATAHQQQQQQHHQPQQLRYAQCYQRHQQQQLQQEDMEGLEGTPAGNYRLLQQHQQQRRQQQQLQYTHLHTAYSAPAPGAAEALTGARSLPHSLHTFAATDASAAPGLLATAYSQPVSVSPHERVSSTYHSNSRSRVYTGQTITHSSHTVTTISAGAHGTHKAAGVHVTAPGQQMPGHQQHSPHQQLSATQQELLALKQQLAEEKRRRKEKKKLRRMQKMLQEQHQQQQGQLQRQQSGLSQQVLYAASQQHRVANNSPNAAASAARGHQASFPTAVPHIQATEAGTEGLIPHHTPGTTPSTYTTPLPKTQHLHTEPWETPAQPQHSRQQQHHGGGSSSSGVAKYHQAQGSALLSTIGAASPHAWQHRRGSSSSPHAAAVDSPSAARQHAVAQSLRQLADKPKQQQQQQQQQTGGGGRAAGGRLISQSSPAPPFQNRSSSSKYISNTPDMHPHPFSPSHSQSHSLTPGPGDSSGPSQGKAAGATDAGGPGISHAIHQGVLPGVPVVLDLGDKPGPDSQAGPEERSQQNKDRAVAQAQWGQTSQQQQQQHHESAEARSIMTADVYPADSRHGMTVAVCAMDNSTDSASIRAFQQTPPTQNSSCRGTPSLAYLDSCATGTAAGGDVAVSSTSAHLASLHQHSSRTGALQAASTGEGASPLSTISSGRKRSFEQTHTTPTDTHALQPGQQLQQNNSSHEAMALAAPAAKLQVLPYQGQVAAASASRATPAQQQQQADPSSQRQARLLQLPFNGPDLAERRDRERERTPNHTAPAHGAAQQQQLGVRIESHESSAPVAAGKSSHAAPAAAADFKGMSSTMQLLAKQPEAYNVPSGSSDWCTTAVPPGCDTNVTSLMSGQHTGARSLSYTGDLRPPMAATAATAARKVRHRGMTLDGSAFTAHGPLDMSMPPPPPHNHTAAPPRTRTNNAAVTAAAAAAGGGGGGCLSPGDSAGGLGNTAPSGFSAVLGSGNVYRTSSGKVLRMLTHPVTGKPLLLGPAVDAKSSRLGNTSLGAPAPQLFGLELQTTSNHGGSGLGMSAGSMSGLSGGVSLGASSTLGSPGTSSSVRADGSSKPRRQSNPESSSRRKASHGSAAGANLSSMAPAHMLHPTPLGSAAPVVPSGLDFVGVPASPHLPVSVSGMNHTSTGVVRHNSNFFGVSTNTSPLAMVGNAAVSSAMFCDANYRGLSEAQGSVAPYYLVPGAAEGWDGSWGACAAAQGPPAGHMDQELYAVQHAVGMPGDEAAQAANLI